MMGEIVLGKLDQEQGSFVIGEDGTIAARVDDGGTVRLSRGYVKSLKGQWFSVDDDSLPEKGLWLVYGSSETGPATMRVDEYDGEWGWTGPLSVTHWRELPLPPEEL